jgi:hypothetical protein
MEEFDFDNNETNFSTSINSIKNKNKNININDDLNYILNYGDDKIDNLPINTYNNNNFPCLTNKCKKYEIKETFKQPINFEEPVINNTTQKKENIQNIQEIDKPKINIKNYIILGLLFFAINCYEVVTFLYKKGFSFYTSLFIRLIIFLSSLYIIKKYNL